MEILKKRDAHEKFVAKHRADVEKKFEANDRVEGYPPEAEKIYKCEELKCAEFPTHAHTRRPYLVFNRRQL